MPEKVPAALVRSAIFEPHAPAIIVIREGAPMMDPIRRNILAAGAAATAMATAPRVFAQQSGQAGAVTLFYEKGNVRIRYEEIGSGFPLLVIPGGGLNSRISGWPTAVINAMEAFKNDFRCITMDQRNATGGESTGPIPVDDPWSAFADDQLGLMDHLGVREFFFMGYCIGGPFGLKLMEQAPARVVASVLCQPVGHRPENPDVMYNSGRDGWATEFRARRPEVSTETIEAYLHNLYRARPDFVYSVSRDFARSCQTPMLVLPDDTPAHAYQTSVDIASLAPNAEVTVYPWKEPPELKARTINRVRTFLKAHQPATAAR
jgi:pimeloyl-ACP methyl ester carboxylesterase